MRVVCDNCGASYKISDTKLTRDVNKATCRKCGHQIVIRRNERESLSPDMVTASSEFEQTEFSPSGMHAFGPGAGYADEVQSTIMNRHNVDHRESTVPRDVPRHAPPVIAEPNPPPMPMPRSALPPSYQATTPPPSYGAAVAIPAPPPKGAAPAPMPPSANTGVVPPHMMPQAQQPMAMPAQGYPQQQGWRPHDPAGDMSLVMMASFGAAIGAGVLASSTTEMQTLVGLGIALWSSITSLMVLVTGDRGRKEAKVFLSMALSLVLAVGATIGFRSTGLAAGLPAQPATAVTPPVAAAPAQTPEPAAPATAPLAALEPTEPAPAEPVKEPEPAVAPEPVVAPVAATTPAASSGSASSSPPVASSGSASSSRPSTSSSSGSSSSGSSSSSRPSSSSSGFSSSGSSSSGSSSSSSTPSSSSTAAPAEATGVPVTVLNTMLSTNKSVKTCFGLYRQETGELPKGRITTKLTIQPNGTVSYAAIDGGPYAGTSLDSCLSSAIKKIQFPPFSGEAATYKYPFIL